MLPISLIIWYLIPSFAPPDAKSIKVCALIQFWKVKAWSVSICAAHMSIQKIYTTSKRIDSTEVHSYFSLKLNQTTLKTDFTVFLLSGC